MSTMRESKKTFAKWCLIGILLVVAWVLAVPAQTDFTQINFLRHAEIDKKNPDKPLTAKGRERAAALVKHFEGIKITHIYASHTDRTRDTVLPLAKAQGLKVQQFPTPGSTVGGEVVTNRSKGKVAIKPLIDALKKVPEGSTVVVGGNSGNLYAIMAGLGVRVATKENPCGKDDMSCLPCADKSCFPKKEFNNLWLVIPAATPSGHATMSRSEYGD